MLMKKAPQELREQFQVLQKMVESKCKEFKSALEKMYIGIRRK